MIEITNPNKLPATWRYQGFGAMTADEARAEFTSKYPEYSEHNPPMWWCSTNHTLFVAWDVERRI